jgi:hypothetical protein
MGQKTIIDFQHSMETVLLQRRVYKWITMFNNVHTSVTDEEKRPGHPPTSTTEKNVEQVHIMTV